MFRKTLCCKKNEKSGLVENDLEEKRKSPSRWYNFEDTSKINANLFCVLLTYSYLCSVKMLFLTIRAESREGKTKSTLPILKRASTWGSFLFQVSFHEHLDVVATFYELS